MKIKKLISILLMVIFLIILLQIDVSAAGNVSYFQSSECDYFLTATNKILTKEDLSKTENSEEEIVIAIQGTYSGTIEYDNATNVINISNCTVDKLLVVKDGVKFNIDGANTINAVSKTTFDNVSVFIEIFKTVGNGTISGYVHCFKSTFVGRKSDYNTIYLGTYIDNTMVEIEGNITNEELDGQNKILPNIEQEINRILDLKTYFYIFVPENTIIPASVFSNLKNNGGSLQVGLSDNFGYLFYGGDFYIKTPTDFNVGFESKNGSPLSGMKDVSDSKAVYLNFANKTQNFGVVNFGFQFFGIGGGIGGDITDYYVYQYNKDTQKYKLATSVNGICFYDFEYSLDKIEPFGQYVLTKNKLPDSLVEGNGNNEPTPNPNPNPNPTPNPSPAPNPTPSTPLTSPVASAPKADTTVREGNILYAGETTTIIICMIIIAVIGVVSYIKSEELKGI